MRVPRVGPLGVGPTLGLMMQSLRDLGIGGGRRLERHRDYSTENVEEPTGRPRKTYGQLRRASFGAFGQENGGFVRRKRHFILHFFTF